MGGEIRAADGNQGGLVEVQHRSLERDLERRIALAISHHRIGEPRCPVVHDPARHDAVALIAEPPEILHGRQQARPHHADAHASSEAAAPPRCAHCASYSARVIG
jgi:hypothetical protein